VGVVQPAGRSDAERLADREVAGGGEGVFLERLRRPGVVGDGEPPVARPLEDPAERRAAGTEGVGLLRLVVGPGLCGRLVEAGDAQDGGQAEDRDARVSSAVVVAPGAEDAVDERDVEVVEWRPKRRRTASRTAGAS
jgi:hypothetical protein